MAPLFISESKENSTYQDMYLMGVKSFLTNVVMNRKNKDNEGIKIINTKKVRIDRQKVEVGHFSLVIFCLC